MKTLQEALRDTERTLHKLSEHTYDKEGGYLSIGMDGMGFGISRAVAEEFGVDLDAAVEDIEVGDTVILWGRGLGARVRGLAIGERLFYHRTTEEDQERHAQEVAQSHAKKKRAYEEAGKADLEERAAKLPEVFQKRIAGFHERNPDFGWKNGGYETFVCEQAVVIADALLTPARIEEFHKSDYKLQETMVPMLSRDHSGNTLGAATSLAHWYLVNPAEVPRVHGALCPLVGCEDYGCWQASQEAKEARTA